MKRTVTLVLALVLVLGLCVPAAAADSAVEMAMERVLQGIREWKTEVDLSDLNIYKEETMAAMRRFYTHPELFYYDNYTLWSSASTGKVSRIDLHYRSGYDQRHVDAFNQASAEAMKCIMPGMDDLQKLLALHDYLVINLKYDEENYNNGTIPETSYTAYGALVLKEAVCQGYSLAYQYLLELCGIPSAYVSSDSMNHGWCMVKLYGNWYHVDVTWDDPTPDKLGRVSHNYFLLSDSAISDAEHKHYGWTSDIACTETYYDSERFWNSEQYPILNTPLIFTDTNTLWFMKEYGDYTDQQICLIRRDWATGGETIVSSVWDYWPVWQENSHWLDAYSTLCYWDNRLFFNDSRNIYSYDPATGETVTEYTYDAQDGYFYGISARTDDLLVLVKQSPRETGTLKRYVPERKYAVNPFLDVNTYDYYYNAVMWAYENGVTTGTSETAFSPDITCTRAQVVTFLWRAMGCPAPRSGENPFGDVPDSAYYRDAVLWAVENGITNGTGTDHETGRQKFDPKAECTYAHILTFLWRTMTGNSASSYGTWYSEPLDWASGQNLLPDTALGSYLSGVTDNCPRGDVVTFLWRAVA